jgi:hypothetical protein
MPNAMEVVARHNERFEQRNLPMFSDLKTALLEHEECHKKNPRKSSGRQNTVRD